MQAQYWWWLIALLLGAFEMLTSTFYLLVLALAFAAGGVVALAGGGLAWQALSSALVAAVGWLILHRVLPRRPRGALSAQADRDVLLDIGERVRVDQWQPGGRAQVRYRGAQWDVQLETAADGVAPGPGVVPPAGEYQIRRLSGNCLVVAPTA